MPIDSVNLYFLYSLIFLQGERYSLQGGHDAVRHMVAEHAGMDNDLGVVLFFCPRDVITRWFNSYEEKKKSEVNDVYILV